MVSAIAYVLITVTHGHSNDVASEIMQFSEVENIHELFGQYDIIVKIKTDNTKNLGKFVRENLIGLSYVESTETLVVSDIPKD